MSNGTFSPTDEQIAIREAFETGTNCVVTAVAGSGKTSTLRLLGESTDRRGFYLAFNKAIQLDAEASFPSNVTAKTSHAMAFRTHAAPRADRVFKSRRLFGRQLAAALNLYEGYNEGEVSLAPSQAAPLVMQMVNRFCLTADRELSAKHVPFVEGVEDRNAFGTYLLPYAQRAWADLQGNTGKLPLSHDHYRKQWALTDPVIKADYIFYDEAQDAEPVMVGVIANQEAQIIAVGDESQSIYQWRGAVNAMQTFGGEHLTLTQSFRFGPKIADEANKWLDILDAPVRVRGYDAIDSQIAPVPTPDAILCRTNAQCIQEALLAQEAGKSVGIVGGTKDIEIFTKAAQRLQSGLDVDHADLVAFDSWNEVCHYVENDDAGADLKVRVNLINKYGADAILGVCSNSVAEGKAEVVVSTAHKSKGREWDTVRVAGDFREPKSVEEGGTGKVSPTDAMLAYVTVTRAKKVLDNSGLAWVDNYVPHKEA